MATETERHVCTEACPTIDAIVDGQLYLGSAAGAHSDLLRDLHVTHVIGVGVPPPEGPALTTLFVDVLDLPTTDLLKELPRCLRFIAQALRTASSRVLVHCMYGQSRSTSVVVAFLMRRHRCSLEAALGWVHRRRPCIHVNPGFLAQLALFSAGLLRPDVQHSVLAHTRLLTAATTKGSTAAGFAFDHTPSLLMAPEVVVPVGTTWVPATTKPLPRPASPPPPQDIRCGSCRAVVATSHNVVLSHVVWHPDGSVSDACSPRACSAVFLEPLAWMCGGGCGPGIEPSPQCPVLLSEASGRLLCPADGCGAKLGAWSWGGSTCGCGRRVWGPSFALARDKVRLVVKRNS